MDFPKIIYYYHNKNVTVTNYRVQINQSGVAISDIKTISKKLNLTTTKLGITSILFGLLFIIGSSGRYFVPGLIFILYGIYRVVFASKSNLLFEISSGETMTFEVKGQFQAKKIYAAINRALSNDDTLLDFTQFTERRFTERRAVVEKNFSGTISAFEDFSREQWGGKYSIYYSNGISYHTKKDIFEWFLFSHIGKIGKDGEYMYPYFRFELIRSYAVEQT